MDKLSPERPRSTGVTEAVPGPGAIEGAHLLADEARARLRRLGFTDGAIDAWAEAYIAEEHSGDVETFLTWIVQHEHHNDYFPAA